MPEPLFKLHTTSLRLIVLAFAAILIMLGLTAAGLYELDEMVIIVAKMVAIVVFFIEIGLLAIIKGVTANRQLGFISGVELIIGALVLIEVLSSTIFSWNIPILSQFSGWILFIFGIAFAIEAFVR